MKKRLVAFLLVLIMVLGMLPVSAFAADDGVSPQALESNETQTIKYQILYVGDEFNTGYNYGVSVNKTYTCQYSTGHSGFNHSILISEFRNVGTGAPASQTRTASAPTVNRVTFTVPGTIPTKDGCTFKGWADSATATTAQYQPGGTVDVKHENSPRPSTTFGKGAILFLFPPMTI